MLEIDNLIYERLAEELASQISLNHIFAGNITFETDELEFKFTATLIPYFTTVEFPEGQTLQLTNIIPVWWEATTTTDNGVEINDFDFQTFKEYICQW